MSGDHDFGWIYDAAFDDDALETMSQRVLAELDCQFFLTGWIDADGNYQKVFAANHDPEFLQAYFEDFAAKDVWLAAEMPYAGQERVQKVSDLVPTADFARSEIYNDFFRPTGMEIYHAASVAATNRDGVGAYGFHRSKGHSDRDFSERDMAMLNAMSTPLRHVLKVRARLRRSEEGVSGFSLVSDRTRIATLMLGERGQLIQANRLAEQVLRDGTILKMAHRRVAGVNGTGAWVDDALRKATRATAPEASSGYFEGHGAGNVAMTMLPLRGHFQRRAMLMLSLPAELTGAHDESLMQAFGLTASEASVIRMLANGETAEGVALARGTSLQTVRVQVRHAMSKMHCSRQVDLVELARRFVVAADENAHTQFEV